MSSPAAVQTRARIWGIDRRWATMLPTWLVAVAVATVPVGGPLVRLSLIAAAAALLIGGVITWSGFTAPQWVARRFSIWWQGRGR